MAPDQNVCARFELVQALHQLTLTPKGDDDYDIEVGPVVIELSRSSDGEWRFWNVRVGDYRFGGTQWLWGCSEFVQWLEAEAQKAARA